MKAETPRVELRQLLSPALQVIPVHAEGYGFRNEVLEE